MVLFIQCSITQIKRSNCRINDTVWISIIQTIIPHTIVANEGETEIKFCDNYTKYNQEKNIVIVKNG